MALVRAYLSPWIEEAKVCVQKFTIRMLSPSYHLHFYLSAGDGGGEVVGLELLIDWESDGCAHVDYL